MRFRLLVPPLALVMLLGCSDDTVSPGTDASNDSALVPDATKLDARLADSAQEDAHTGDASRDASADAMRAEQDASQDARVDAKLEVDASVDGTVADACQAKTCEDQSIECGEVDDGCGKTLVCGDCVNNKVCHESGMCICPILYMTRSGSVVSPANEIDRTPWVDASNVLVQDDAATTVNLTEDAPFSDRLRVTGFGFTLPAGARGLSVTVRVRQRSDVGSLRETSVWLYNGSSYSSAPRGGSKSMPTSYDTLSYGFSVSGTNGEKPTSINDPDFGVALRASHWSSDAFYAGMADDKASIDHVEMTVSYYPDCSGN